MSMRSTVNPSVDARIFNRTARMTKRANIHISNMRGGVRL